MVTQRIPPRLPETENPQPGDPAIAEKSHSQRLGRDHALAVTSAGVKFRTVSGFYLFNLLSIILHEKVSQL